MKEKCLHNWKSAVVCYILKRSFRSSSSVNSTNVVAACYTSFFSVVFDSSFNICCAKTRVDCGRSEVTHLKSMSHLKNRICYGKSEHVFATKNVPAQQSATRLRKKVKLRWVLSIYNMLICSGWSKNLVLDALDPTWKTLSVCSWRETLEIWFAHLGRANFMSPGAS